jgi:hypothetical protein
MHLSARKQQPQHPRLQRRLLQQLLDAQAANQSGFLDHIGFVLMNNPA